MNETLVERAKREREAKQKWLNQYKENKEQEELEKQEKELERQEKELEARKKWEIYQQTDEYKQLKEEQTKKEKEENLKRHIRVREEGLKQIQIYREKYSMPNEPMFKVYKAIYKKEDFNVAQSIHSWVGYQINTENMLPLDEIKKMKNTRALRLNVTIHDDDHAMYTFGQRIHVYYEDIDTLVEDLVWSYNQPPGEYVEFYYHTEINNIRITTEGFLYGVDIDMDGFKIIQEKSLVDGAELYNKETIIEKNDIDKLYNLLDNEFTGMMDVGNIIINNESECTELTKRVWKLKRKVEWEYGVKFNRCSIQIQDHVNPYYNRFNIGDDLTALVCIGVPGTVFIRDGSDKKKCKIAIDSGDVIMFRRKTNDYSYKFSKNNHLYLSRFSLKFTYYKNDTN